MSKAGGRVLILLWNNLRRRRSTSCPGLLSSQPAGSLLLPSASHYRPAYTSTPPSLQPLEKEDYIDRCAYLQLGTHTHTCMYFVILLIRTSDDCSKGDGGVGREIKVNLDRSCSVFPGRDVSRGVYHDQPCSCNDAWGWSDPRLTSFSSLAFYPGLPADHNPDLVGQSASKYDALWHEFSFNVLLEGFSLICPLVLGPACQYSWAGLQKASEERTSVPKRRRSQNRIDWNCN